MQKKSPIIYFLKSLLLICSKNMYLKSWYIIYIYIYIYIYTKKIFVKRFYCLFKVIPLRVGRIVSLKFRSFILGPFILIIIIHFIDLILLFFPVQYYKF